MTKKQFNIEDDNCQVEIKQLFTIAFPDVYFIC